MQQMTYSYSLTVSGNSGCQMIFFRVASSCRNTDRAAGMPKHTSAGMRNKGVEASTA